MNFKYNFSVSVKFILAVFLLVILCAIQQPGTDRMGQRISIIRF